MSLKDEFDSHRKDFKCLEYALGPLGKFKEIYRCEVSYKGSKIGYIFTEDYDPMTRKPNKDAKWSFLSHPNCDWRFGEVEWRLYENSDDIISDIIIESFGQDELKLLHGNEAIAVDAITHIDRIDVISIGKSMTEGAEFYAKCRISAIEKGEEVEHYGVMDITDGSIYVNGKPKEYTNSRAAIGAVSNNIVEFLREMKSLTSEEE